MNKFLLLLFLPTIVFAQIKIDLRKKTQSDIGGNVFYINKHRPNAGFKISKSDSEWNTHLYNLGSSSVLTYSNQSKLITTNLAGDITFYDLPTGRITRHIPFSLISRKILASSSKNKNSFITNLSLSKNEEYLIFKTFDLTGTNDKFIDYFLINIENIESKTKKIDLVSLYSFENTNILDEENILNSNTINRHEKNLKKIQSLVVSDKIVKLKRRFDGIYFTSYNNVPIKFILLGDKTYFDALNFFTKIRKELFVSPQRYIENYSYGSDYKKLDELVNNKYNLADFIKNNNGNFALLSSSYGSENNAVLIKIDDMLIGADELYENSIKLINSYFTQNIQNNRNNLIELEQDKLYIKFEDGKYYFVSPWLEQSNFTDKDLKIFGSSYEWKYFKEINEINELNLEKSILTKLNNYEFICFGWENNKLFRYDSSIEHILNYDTPITDERLFMSKALVKKIDFDKVLPKLINTEEVLESEPSQDIGKRSCEVCSGRGFISREIYKDYVYFNGKYIETYARRKCFNCSGKGHYNLVTGDFEKKKIIKYDKWSLSEFKNCSDNNFIAIFKSNKRTYLQETRGGYVTKGKLTNNEPIIQSYLLDTNGNIIKSEKKLMNLGGDCNEYHPIAH